MFSILDLDDLQILQGKLQLVMFATLWCFGDSLFARIVQTSYLLEMGTEVD